MSGQTILHQFNHFGNGHVRSSCRTLQRNSTISVLCKENSKEMGTSITMPHPGGSNRCLTGMSVSRRGPPQANLTPGPLTPSRSKDATQEKVIKQTRLN